MNHDVFISYASEDKIDVVQPLYDLLTDAGLRVWLDDKDLLLGGNLRKEIERGLADSRFGVVVLSPAYMRKLWPQRELDALLALETPEREKILPVWHNLGPRDAVLLSSVLASRVAISTDKGMEVVASKILVRVFTDRGIDLFHTYYPSDRVWFEEAKEIFNRPAWVGAYHGFTGQELYQKAIKRTIKALNTGVIENDDHSVSKNIKSVNFIKDGKLNTMMLRITSELKRIDNLIDIHNPYPGTFPGVVSEINGIRDKIIRELNEVWAAFGIHTLPLPSEVTITMDVYDRAGGPG
jgi:hypothetical protein